MPRDDKERETQYRGDAIELGEHRVFTFRKARQNTEAGLLKMGIEDSFIPTEITPDSQAPTVDRTEAYPDLAHPATQRVLSYEEMDYEQMKLADEARRNANDALKESI